MLASSLHTLHDCLLGSAVLSSRVRIPYFTITELTALKRPLFPLEALVKTGQQLALRLRLPLAWRENVQSPT